MTDMRRLRDETRSPFARALLESAREDRPESGACDRALGALGLGTAGVIATGSAVNAAAHVAGSAASASSFAPSAAKGGLFVLVKWIGIGVLGSAVTIGSIAYVAREAQPRAPTTIVSPRRPSGPAIPVPRATFEAAPRPRAGTAIAHPAATDDAASASRSRAPGVGPMPQSSGISAAPVLTGPDARGRAPAERDDVAPEASGSIVAETREEISAKDPLAAQLDALRAVRAALGSGDPARALVLLGALETRNPGSPLAEEIAVLRIDALVDSGRGAEASALAAAFVNAYPQSAYGEHVHSKVKSR